MKRPRWSEITIMLYTSPLCSLIIHEGFWEEIISDLMETHQSLTDVPLHNLQLPLHKHTAERFFAKFPSQSATDLYDHHNILIKLCLSPFGTSRLGSRSQRSVCWNTSLLCLCQTADVTPANCLDLLSSRLLLFSLALLVFFPLLLFSAFNSLLITHFYLTMFRSCYSCYFCSIHTHTIYIHMNFRGIVHPKNENFVSIYSP